MIDVSVKLPELETVKLENLHRGNTFMLPNKTHSYTTQSLVYMSLGDRYNPTIDCVCLNDGTIKKIGSKTQVIRLLTTIECKYISADYDDGLPF